MLQTIKMALRITTNSFDTEINHLIGAAIADLVLAGISTTKASTSSTDALVVQAVICYCKAHFGDKANAEKWQASYDMQKAQMQMATGYRWIQS